MKRLTILLGLALVALVACTTPPVVTPNPATGGAGFALGSVNAFKIRSASIHYALRPHNAFFAVPDTLVVDYTAPAPNGGSPITGYDVRIKMDNTLVKTIANPAGVMQAKWVIAGVGPSQTVQLVACGNARNAMGAGPESCSTALAYTGADLVPGQLQTITVTKKPTD